MTTPDEKPKAPHTNVRKAYYAASDGAGQLAHIAIQIKHHDPEFARLVDELSVSISRIRAHLDARYRWD